MRISKELLLKATNHGREFLEFALPQLRRQGDGGYKVINSPFRVDRNPSFSVYFNDETARWMFKDFGDPDVHGDVFDLAALHYDLDVQKNFVEIMQRMVKDLELDLDTVRAEEPDLDSLLWSLGYEMDYSGEDAGLLDAYAYFKQFGITREVLSEYQVKSVKAVRYIKDGEERKIVRRPGQHLIAYYAGSFTKIYSPHPEKFFMYLNGKRKDYVFGYREILNRNAKGIKLFSMNYAPRDVLVITGGEKDVLTLASLGYDAISLNSETSSIIPQAVTDLFSSYERVVVLYDLDDTGKKCAEKLAGKYGDVICITLPNELREKGGKDVSDYMKFGMDVDLLRDLICKGTTDVILRPSSVADLDSNTIPDQVYDLLPGFLKNVTGHFTDHIERDLILLSAIGTLSSCFPTVKGIYRGKSIGLNQFILVTAPASSGKGVMDWSLMLVEQIDKYFLETYKVESQKYRRLLNEYNECRKKNPDLIPPEKPARKRLLIPANSSNSAITEFLCSNENFGLTFETEADTLTNTLKHDWANFSDLLRKAFHHERVSMARRADDEDVQAAHPHWSVVLSGTPSQVEALINSVENGLFSRFMFYDFRSPLIWKGIDDYFNEDLEESFEKYGATILDFWSKAHKQKEVRITLSNHQIKIHSEYFGKKQQQLFDIYGDSIVPSIRRHGIVVTRIAMLFTFIRSIGSGAELTNPMVVHDDDFTAAMGIIEVVLKHLERVYSRLQEKVKVSVPSSLKQQLFDALSGHFTTTECFEKASSLGINQKTAEKYLKDFSDKGYLEKPKRGEYNKK